MTVAELIAALQQAIAEGLPPDAIAILDLEYNSGFAHTYDHAKHVSVETIAGSTGQLPCVRISNVEAG